MGARKVSRILAAAAQTLVDAFRTGSYSDCAEHADVKANHADKLEGHDDVGTGVKFPT